MIEVRLSEPRVECLFSALRAAYSMFSSCVFRGQADSGWKLIPALYRQPHVSKSRTLYAEQLYQIDEERLLEEFFHHACAYGDTKRQGPLRDRALAQHYGVPTQLLDWTLDPLTATFFAVSDRLHKDGAIYFLETSTRAREGVTSEVRVFPHIGPVTVFSPPSIDARIVAQKSVFSLQAFGPDEHSFTPLDDRDLSLSPDPPGKIQVPEAHVFGRIIVPKKFKFSLLAEIRNYGIDHARLFPGLAGIGHELAFSRNLR